MDVTTSVIQHVAITELMHGSQVDSQEPPTTTEDGDDDADANTTASRGALGAVGAVVARIESILETSSARRASETRPEQIRFPGRTVQEARKFARILLILQLAHDALVSGTILTKRHIFYQYQDLFDKQSQVDELVDDLAFTLGVNRGDLNIAYWQGPW
ncbi:hypothetical protein G7Z17_g4999 [Cylindrodendrum hubeiense]|uniref:Spo11/DNA topoisomerase VI subunit A N-terminal domain-containing protein n=1 Tax=Cylindrodendrum hubeiense TaxID=595255 RepID=A0A9P5H9T0_9HYPO|nr:hypothetical protein G7Z17_g4999 [Cylindrodendrum hubeiense]